METFVIKSIQLNYSYWFFSKLILKIRAIFLIQDVSHNLREKSCYADCILYFASSHRIRVVYEQASCYFQNIYEKLKNIYEKCFSGEKKNGIDMYNGNPNCKAR